MARGITHTKVLTVPDAAPSTAVRPSDWNAEHVVNTLFFNATFTPPTNPIDGDAWVEVTGPVGAEIIAIKIKLRGTVITVTSRSYP